MSTVKFLVIWCVLSVQVSCWTVDLAEMNRLNIESGSNEKSFENEESKTEYDDYETSTYSELEYNSYMEKRIHGVLNNGSIYLDGLRKAMAHYRQKLDECTTTTTTESSTWLPENDPRDQIVPDPCRSIISASDQVTKLSELALWATNELRERKFAKNKDTAAQEEEELLMKLAWFLDQLAQLTGYVPDPNEFTTLESTTETVTETTESLTTVPETTIPYEIMQSVENGPPLSKLPPKKSNLKNIKKRSADDEMTHFVKNYIKYKIWNADNTEHNVNNKNSDSFDVKNEIKTIQKRSTFTKKAIRLRTTSKSQKNKPIKPKSNNLKKNHKNGGFTAKKHFNKATPKLTQKRSVYYYEPHGLSRIPEDPMQDISFYVKNKPGTLYSPSLEQVALVQANLQQHYNLATFEKIKRFGSNATLGMDNLLLGSLKSMSDAQ